MAIEPATPGLEVTLVDAYNQPFPEYEQTPCQCISPTPYTNTSKQSLALPFQIMTHITEAFGPHNRTIIQHIFIDGKKMPALLYSYISPHSMTSDCEGVLDLDSQAARNTLLHFLSVRY